ncbi:MAG: 2,3-diaminopropionate biosynthesis protein SbnA [Vicinamibacterales bacterium]
MTRWTAASDPTWTVPEGGPAGRSGRGAIKGNVLEAIGNTPLIHLQRLLPDRQLEVYAKLEALNPGGSLKDRAALRILERAIESGAVRAGTVVVESSSGNMGIGLAQVCRYLGLRFLCVADPRTTAQNIALLKAYGADVEIIGRPDPATGEYLTARIARVRELLQEIPNSFWPNQYANTDNAEAHRAGTMAEIVTALDGAVDYVFCATSTCGTLRGCAELVAALGLPTRVIAVDAAGSAIFGGPKAERLIPGFGAGIVPALFHENLAAECLHVSTLECIVSCRLLARREAILGGGSSGAVVAAIRRMQPRLPRGARCVLVLCDRGERYLDTIYSDEWVTERFGEVTALWDDREAVT